MPADSIRWAENRTRYLLGDRALAVAGNNLARLLVFAYAQGVIDGAEHQRRKARR